MTLFTARVLVQSRGDLFHNFWCPLRCTPSLTFCRTVFGLFFWSRFSLEGCKIYLKQSRLSHATVCLPLREPRFEGKQASCHPRSTKVLEKNKTKRTFKDFSMQQHLLIFMRRHIITVLLFNQCLSSNCADSLLRISKPRYFELFSITLATSK